MGQIRPLVFFPPRCPSTGQSGSSQIKFLQGVVCLWTWTKHWDCSCTRNQSYQEYPQISILRQSSKASLKSTRRPHVEMAFHPAARPSKDQLRNSYLADQPTSPGTELKCTPANWIGLRLSAGVSSFPWGATSSASAFLSCAYS